MTREMAVHVGQALQVLLGMVFIVAGIGKVRHPSQFVAAVSAYNVLPRQLSHPIALGVIAAELLLGVALSLGWALDVTVPAAGLLLLAFAGAVGVNLRRGAAIPCGCFGSMNELISTRTLARLGLLMVVVLGLLAVRTASAFPPLNVTTALSGEGGGLDRLVVAGALGASLLVLGTWLLHLPEIGRLFRRAADGT